MPTQPLTTPAARPLWPVYAILAISIAPLLLALAAYYLPALGLRPMAQANYGQLLSPQRAVPAPEDLALQTLDHQPFDLHSLRGRWVLLSADSGHCDQACVRKLFILRNSHASQGKNVERMTRVWLLTDQENPTAQIQTAYQGTHMLRVKPEQLRQFLPDEQTDLHAHMWVIDPNGNLMMRFPADADPLKVRKDLTQLLKYSRIG